MSSWDEDAEDGSFGALLQAVAGTPPTQPALPAGARIAEHYEVIRSIGAGGMGVVYLATDVRLGRRVALKLHNVDAREQTRHRTLREAIAMARLQHPNVVAVHDVGHVDDGQLFIAMEFVDGVTLRAWLNAEPRSGPEIIRQFIQAGRGLSAAHERGLVHRDVKPDNILVGHDGRVRVADFGLASRRGDLPDASTDPFARLPNRANITKTGSFVGTPAYAAPEQWRNAPLDARSDQFSFCAAMFEALYGRDQSGDLPIAEFISKVATGEARWDDSSSAPRTPAAARRILMRGLSIDPADRFRDMATLVRLLEELLAVRRRRAWLAGGAILLALAGVGGAWAARPASCSGQGPLDAFWTPERRATTTSALSRATLPAADDMVSRVIVELDDYGRRWSDAHLEACRAASTRATKSTQIADRRTMCLEHRARAFRALVSALASSNTERAARALKSAIDLPSTELCSDPRYLVALAPPPASVQMGQQVTAAREALARAGALMDGGDFEAALSAARQTAEAVRTLDYLPVRAEADWAIGRAERLRGHFDEARASLERAYFTAQQAGHEVVAIEIATDLVYLLSFDMGDSERAIEWGRHASAAVERIGGAGVLRGRLLTNLGTALEQDSQFDEAVDTTRRAVEDLERNLGPRNVDLATALTRYGSALEAKGDRKAAVEVLQRAVEMTEQIFGPNHRQLHRPLAELGLALSPIGDNDGAIAVQTRALDICRKAFGSEHVNTGFAELNLGVAYHFANDMAKAGLHYRRAARIVEQALGPDHRDTALCLTNLALTMPDQPKEAAELHRRVVRIFEKQGPRHTDVGRARINLARVLLGLQDYEGVYREALEAAEIWNRATPDGPNVAFALQLVGLAKLEGGRPDEAVAPLARAVQIREAADFSAKYLADSRFALARALDTPRGDRARAVRLAQAALAAYEQLGQPGAEARDEVRAWLARR